MIVTVAAALFIAMVAIRILVILFAAIFGPIAEWSSTPRFISREEAKLHNALHALEMAKPDPMQRFVEWTMTPAQIWKWRMAGQAMIAITAILAAVFAGEIAWLEIFQR